MSARQTIASIPINCRRGIHVSFLLLAGILFAMPPTKTANGAVSASKPAVRAFPEAEGHGAESMGGRGGRVIYVTNLNNEGAGSLREALQASGPRIVAFKIAGIINLQETTANPRGDIHVTSPYITIAGQTAPGGGITVRGMICLDTHDIIMRFINIRPGKGAAWFQTAGIEISSDACNLIVDHVSVSWANDDTINLWPGAAMVGKLTLSWNLVAEGLRNEKYAQGGDPSKGMMLGGGSPNTINVSVHHNAMMKFTNRFPWTQIEAIEIANNLMYHGAWNFIQVLGGGQTDIIGNIYKRLPENSKEITTYSAHDPTHIPGHPSIYLKDNTGPSQPNPGGNNWRMVSGPVSHRDTPLPPPTFPITIHPVKVLETIVLADVGNSRRLDANGKWVARRDLVDTRLIKEYRTNTGILPYHENEVGGWPVIASGTPYNDTDNDGMPDAWEIKYRLNPNEPNDANQDANGNGYTNMEEFLNGTNPLLSFDHVQ